MSSFLLPNGVGGPVFRLAMVDPDGGLYVTRNGMSPTDGRCSVIEP
jgi:hypothetical protein